MKFFQASFQTIVLRYYFMMALIMISFFVGIPYLALLALPLFLSALMGISFKKAKQDNTAIRIAPNEYNWKRRPAA